MLVQIGLAFGFVELKFIHEYKLFLFYSLRKIWKDDVTANSDYVARRIILMNAHARLLTFSDAPKQPYLIDLYKPAWLLGNISIISVPARYALFNLTLFINLA